MRTGTALLCFTLAACGGDSKPDDGGGGGGGNPGGDQTAPQARFQFPPDGALTDEATLPVTLAATDDTGVASVSIGAVPASFDANRSLWRAVVALQPSTPTTLAASTRDTLGNSFSRAAQITVHQRSALWAEASAATFDPVSGAVLVVDPVLRTVTAVDVLFGGRTLLSGQGAGSGPGFGTPEDIDYVASRALALVVDRQFDAVFSVDPATGARAVLSSPTVGGGETPFDLHGIAVDEARNRALVLDEVRSEVLAVDLSTGFRTVVSGDTTGAGPLLITPRRIAVDAARNRALVSLVLSRSILAVDLTTGDRTLFAGGGAGSGPEIAAPFDLEVDANRDRLLVTDPGSRTLFEVQLSSGARSLLVDPTIEWRRPSGLTQHLGGVPLVVDPGLDALFEVGATSGSLRQVTEITVGSGNSFFGPSSLAALPTGGFFVADSTATWSVSATQGARVLLSGNIGLFESLVDALAAGGPTCLVVLDDALPGLFEVNSTSGSVRTISNAVTGSGPALLRPQRMVVDRTLPVSGCASSALVLCRPLGAPAQILRVHLTTGARTLVSDVTRGSGPNFGNPVALDVDAGLGVAYVLDTALTGVLSVDLATGNRALIAAGLGALSEPTDLVFDEPRGRLVIADAGRRALLGLDLTTQFLTVLSDDTLGGGPVFARPLAVAIVNSPTLVGIAASPIAYVLDATRAAVLAVDLATGERVIYSK